MGIEERLARLRESHTSRLLSTWVHVDERGRQRLTLLAAYAPEVTERGYVATACPEDQMPGWLALSLEMFGQLDEPSFSDLAARFVALAPMLLRLPPARLVRLDYESRAVALRAVRARAIDPRALGAVDRVLALLEAAARGVARDESAWLDARAHAFEVARASAPREDAYACAAAHAAAGWSGDDARGAAYGTALDGLEGKTHALAPLIRGWLEAWEQASELG